MTISSYEIVFFTAVFLLPGFFMRSIVASLNPVKKSSDNAEFLYCLMYSIINLAVWSWSYALVTQLKKAYCLADWVYWVIIVLITMIGATITAFLIGAIIQKRFVRWLGNKFNLNTIDPTDTAWDWLFAKWCLSKNSLFGKRKTPVPSGRGVTRWVSVHLCRKCPNRPYC